MNGSPKTLKICVSDVVGQKTPKLRPERKFGFIEILTAIKIFVEVQIQSRPPTNLNKNLFLKPNLFRFVFLLKLCTQ